MEEKINLRSSVLKEAQFESFGQNNIANHVSQLIVANQTHDRPLLLDSLNKLQDSFFKNNQENPIYVDPHVVSENNLIDIFSTLIFDLGSKDKEIQNLSISVLRNIFIYNKDKNVSMEFLSNPNLVKILFNNFNSYTKTAQLDALEVFQGICDLGDEMQQFILSLITPQFIEPLLFDPDQEVSLVATKLLESIAYNDYHFLEHKEFYSWIFERWTSHFKEFSLNVNSFLSLLVYDIITFSIPRDDQTELFQDNPELNEIKRMTIDIYSIPNLIIEIVNRFFEDINDRNGKYLLRCLFLFIKYFDIKVDIPASTFSQIIESPEKANSNPVVLKYIIKIFQRSISYVNNLGNEEHTLYDTLMHDEIGESQYLIQKIIEIYSVLSFSNKKKIRDLLSYSLTKISPKDEAQLIKFGIISCFLDYIQDIEDQNEIISIIGDIRDLFDDFKKGSMEIMNILCQSFMDNNGIEIFNNIIDLSTDEDCSEIAKQFLDTYFPGNEEYLG